VPDTANEDTYAAARANIRDTIKWLITAFAGLAAVIVGTTPLTGFGSLEGGSLALAAVSGTFGIGCALYAIHIALNILVTPTFFLSDIQADAKLTLLIDDHYKDLLPTGIKTLKQFMEDKDSIEAKLIDLRKAERAAAGDEDALKKLKTKIEVQQASLNVMLAVRGRLLGLAHFERLRRDFDRSRHSLFVLAVGSVLFLTVFSWITIHAKAPAMNGPVRVILDRDAGAK
jgi:hypothetical protein